MKLTTGAYEAQLPGEFRSPEAHQLLADVVYSRLTFKSNGGLWHYYNFTSASAVFDSDRPLKNRLEIEFGQPPSGTSAPQLISAIRLELNCGDQRYFDELTSLLRDLVNHFHLDIVAL